MQTVSEKVNTLIRKHGITQNELSLKTKVSKQVLSAICKGKVKHSKALMPIAKYFGVEYDWLINCERIAEPHVSKNQSQDDILVLDSFKKIPLLMTKILHKGMLKDNKLMLQNITDDFELTNDPDYSSLFVLSSTNNSLKFRFGDKTTLIFHIGLTPVAGDFVIAYLPEKELFVYRDLEIINNEKILIPVDPDIYKPITLKSTDIIVAVLYEKRIKRPF